MNQFWLNICEKLHRMDYISFVKNYNERKALSGILIIIGFVLVGMFVGQLLQLFILLFSSISDSDGGSLTENLLKASTGEVNIFSNWWATTISVGVASFFSFILSGVTYWKLIERRPLADLNSNKGLPSATSFILVFLIFVLTAPFIGYLGSINENIQLPAAFSALEEMMKSMEEATAKVTEFLTTTTHWSQLLANLIVVGVFAGVGEELIFRGLLQRKLLKGLGNHHLAIWIAAFLFSAIHFQFYGFFPRLVLGVLFGYLFVWSGNLWIPIFAHTLNNSVAVILAHLISIGKINKEYENLDTFPFTVVLVTSLLCVFLLQIFLNYHQQKKPLIS